jgi:hypothetical protein
VFGWPTVTGLPSKVALVAPLTVKVTVLLYRTRSETPLIVMTAEAGTASSNSIAGMRIVGVFMKESLEEYLFPPSPTNEVFVTRMLWPLARLVSGRRAGDDTDDYSRRRIKAALWRPTASSTISTILANLDQCSRM